LKPEFIEFIENARKPRGQRFRNQLYVFLVCLGISVFIWSLVRLSKDYIYSVNYQVRYINVPSNLRLVSKSDTAIRLNIKVQGFDFFSEQYFMRKSHLIDISLHHVKLFKHDKSTTGYLLTSQAGKEIAAQLIYPLEIYSYSPDTLYFTFERRTTKTVSPLKSKPTPETITRQVKDTLSITRDSLQNKSPGSDRGKNKKKK